MILEWYFVQKILRNVGKRDEVVDKADVYCAKIALLPQVFIIRIRLSRQHNFTINFSYYLYERHIATSKNRK